MQNFSQFSMILPTDVKILGLICLLLGIFIRYQINRRKFSRRNVAGLETFSSYGKAVGTHFLEKIGKLIGMVLIIIGLMVVVMWWTKGKM